MSTPLNVNGHMIPVPAVPVPPRGRLVGVDATRGIALLGMMAVHALYGYDDAGDPTVIFSVAAGRSAAIFAVLAGVGIAFTTGRERVRVGRRSRTGSGGRAAAASLAARALVIGFVGLALGYTDAEIAKVILPYYAVLYVLAIPLVFLGNRALIALGVLIALGIPALSHNLRLDLPAGGGTNPSFEQLFVAPHDLLTELLLTGEYPALPWMAYLCAGIVLGRLPLSSARTAVWLLGSGAALAAVALVASEWILGPGGGLVAITAAGTGDPGTSTATLLAFGADGVTPTTSWWWLVVHAPHTGTPADLLHTTGVAIGLLGALLLSGHVTNRVMQPVITALVGPLAAAGAMSFTLYTGHVVFMNSPLDTFEPVPGYVVQVVAALLLALAWRQAVGRGPLEAAVTWAAGRAARRERQRPARIIPTPHRAATGRRR